MTIPHITEKRMTVEEFLDFVQLPGNVDKRWEFDRLAVPDLGINVLPNHREFFDTFKIIQSDLISGTHAVWMLSPKSKTVYVWRVNLTTDKGLRIEVFNEEDYLNSDVLPDFTLAVKDIFPE